MLHFNNKKHNHRKALYFPCYISKYTEEQFKKWIQATGSYTHKYITELLVQVFKHSYA